MISERVVAVLNGVDLAPSKIHTNIHRVYGGLELTKIALLVGLSRAFN